MKNSKAITLVSLIVIIVILIILAAVTINMLVGENGILNKAQKAVSYYEKMANEEMISLASIPSVRDDSAKIAQLEQEIAELKKNTNPPGTVISYIGSSLPEGYLSCDGSKYSVNDYPKLYAALKNLDHTGWKEANWVTEFTVPDLRGEFLRGTGENSHANSITGTNEGSGANVGKHQGATSLPYFGNYNDATLYINMYASGENSGGVGNYDVLASKSGTRYYRDIGISTSNTGRSVQTTRPTNTSVLYCIKI